MNRTPDFDEIAKLMLEDARPTGIILPFNKKPRNVIQRFLDWLFGLQRVELPKTKEGWFTSKKPKRENNDEQMATIDELFEPDWDAKETELRRKHSDIMMNLQRLHAENMQDAKRDHHEELVELLKAKKRSERPKAPPPQPTFKI